MRTLHNCATTVACTALALVCPAGALAQSFGQWGPIVPLQLTQQPDPPHPPVPQAMLSVHAALLPDGRVLCVDFLGSHGGPGDENRPDAVLFDPSDSSVKLVWESGPADEPQSGYPGLPPGNGSLHRLYCSGHAWTGGLLVFRGGNENGPGNEKTTIYDPAMGPVGGFRAGPNERWCLVPGTCPPSAEVDTLRWYPTLKTTRAGHLFASDGHQPPAPIPTTETPTRPAS